MNAAAPTTPRVLLRTLREVLAAQMGAQARLDRVVQLVAQNMVAEVCSIYVLRTDNLLELGATIGLNPNAVHNTVLAMGEGLVGTVAQDAGPLNLTDAPTHPKFAYRPETGEDPFKSFLGVPILRGGRPRGVLVVQNQTSRQYAEEDVEALETVAMVIAEMMAATEFHEMRVAKRSGERLELPMSFTGTALCPGAAMGTAVLHEPRVRVTKLIAENIEKETARLDEAVNMMREAIDAILRVEDPSLAGAPLDILETYRMFANDKGWLARIKEAVQSGLTAEAAVERVQNDTRAKMMRQRDRYLRERLSDLDDLANRLLRYLTGAAGTAAELPRNMILVARTMGPADLLDYDRERIAGLVLETGTPASHVAIVARALDIPTVAGVDDIEDHIETGDQIIVDAERAQVHIRPQADIVKAFEANQALSSERRARFAAARDLEPVTMDGERIRLKMNAGLLFDLPHLEETAADGIGLFRTELQFMVARQFPRLDAQATLYSQVIEAAAPKPVTFRTLDLGGDKILPYGEAMDEENPALGWRALRIALDRPALLRYQIRAMLRAGAGADLRIMFPMVAEVEEFRQAKALVDRQVEWHKARGHEMPKSIKLGCMLEVPSIVWQLDALLPEIDFLSIGTNDLVQFLFAADRMNPRVATRYDFLSPAVLSFIRMIVEKTDRAGVPVTVCGEAAGRPLEALALLAVGIRSLSMPAPSIAPIKFMVRSLHLKQAIPFVAQLLALGDHSVRPQLQDYAEKNGILI